MACTFPQVETRLSSGQSICLFSGAQQSAIASFQPGDPTFQAPLITIRDQEGLLKQVAFGALSLDRSGVYNAGIGAPGSVGGLLGQLTPYILLAQQIGLSALLPGAATAVLRTAESSYETRRRGMALNLSGILQSASSVLGGFDNSYLSTLGNVASFASNFVQPAPAQVSYAPVYSPFPAVQQPQAQPVGLPLAVAAGAIAARVAPILAKIAVKLGLRARPSLNRAMEIVRKAGKLLQSPEAVAVALGITTAELASLIVSSQARKRRRMNPANSKALRRAARRIKSFHRLCVHTDVLKSRGRSKSRSCGTCRKSPCRC